MSDVSYDVNFKKLVVLLTPTFMRVPTITAFLQAAASQIAYLLTLLVKFRATTNYRLTHNGQVCYLRAVLNDQFDPIDRRIEIGDADNKEPVLIYWREMDRLIPDRNNPVLIVSSRGYVGSSGYDFVVKVPFEIYSASVTIQQMKAVVTEYKLASKQFDIIPL